MQRPDLHGHERQRVAVGARERSAAVARDAVAARDVDDVDRHAEVLLEEHGDLARDAVGAAARGPRAHQENRAFGVASAFTAPNCCGNDQREEHQRPRRRHVAVREDRAKHLRILIPGPLVWVFAW